jgi:threonine dehydrogenase-like Zn-dependent dehydrogenase
VKAAVLAEVGRLGLEERPEPALQAADEVLLEVEACGVCGTDLHILEDPPGHPANVGVVLGHEFVARVVEAGEAVSSLGRATASSSRRTCGAGSASGAGAGATTSASTGPHTASSSTADSRRSWP